MLHATSLIYVRDSFDMNPTTRISKTPGSVGAAHILSTDDRAGAGNDLRAKVPREWHGGWKEFKGRPNPIDVLQKSGCQPIEGTLADPLRQNVEVTCCILSRVYWLDGLRLVANAEYRPSGPQ